MAVVAVVAVVVARCHGVKVNNNGTQSFIRPGRHPPTHRSSHIHPPYPCPRGLHTQRIRTSQSTPDTRHRARGRISDCRIEGIGGRAKLSICPRCHEHHGERNRLHHHAWNQGIMLMLCPRTEHNPSWVVWYLLGTTDMGPGQGRRRGTSDPEHHVPYLFYSHSSIQGIRPHHIDVRRVKRTQPVLCAGERGILGI